ncbi:uncharacterized protein SPSK_02091 [Sporothrix schenckii 1099-18]|uniref:Uncharacterized protein n=1 Tax=Sporothrix schenckii 1099-18 TaxID=1397361 RepID=A0A0F2MC59_SPOSC|nr:uncharacterized protein SPSK_02091 [Sporothrix schenckii 1099-18]KJR87227.1 hypothetical protein SPSK_02091 [Sporothrix schenckii 1099-18]
MLRACLPKFTRQEHQPKQIRGRNDEEPGRDQAPAQNPTIPTQGRATAIAPHAPSHRYRNNDCQCRLTPALLIALAVVATGAAAPSVV